MPLQSSVLTAEGIAAVTAVIGSAFGILRMGLAEARRTGDRFLDYMEGALARQEAIHQQMTGALEQLSTAAREQSTLLERIAERLNLGMNGDYQR